MLRDDLKQRIQLAIAGMADRGLLPVADLPEVEIADPRDPSHGDFACNFALMASKAVGKPPREIAEALKDALQDNDDGTFAAIEVAGPGFLNLRLTPTFVARYVRQVLTAETTFGSSKADRSQKINVEYVSVNPNGPITIGSGRGAAFGSTLSNVLEAAGHEIHREYYINDGTNSEQMRLFAESARALYEGQPLPDNGYKGDYVAAVAEEIKASGVSPDASNPNWWQEESQALMLDAQKRDLTTFGTTFDTWFSEQSLHVSGRVVREIDAVIAAGGADTDLIRRKLKLGKGGIPQDVEIEIQTGNVNEEGEAEDADGSTPVEGASPTLWLRSTKFGDDMDRVLRRRDGRLTYISSDIAYHKDKFNRPEGANKLITVLGPDHHGYIGRLTAVLAAVELAEGAGRASTRGGMEITEPLSEVEAKIYASPAERDACQAALVKARKELEVVIFQLVRFLKDGKPAPMRKRDGNIYALIDLIKEIGQHAKPSAPAEEQLAIGRDVARFFYLMRSHDTTFDFDLNLAEKQSDENPVFYVQYAHARICSLIEKAREAGLDPEDGTDRSHLLGHEREHALIKKICDLPYEVKRCAEDYGVHRLTTYATELARAYHAFYDACRVIDPDNRELSQARLSLCLATRIALRSTFRLLGIGAPERMDREAATLA